jgi:hypothetical protein
MNSFHRWFCRTSIWKKALANEIIPFHDILLNEGM